MPEPCTVGHVQKMENFIMNALDWRVQTMTPSEVSMYYLRKYLKEQLNKRVEAFPIEELKKMIDGITKKGLLDDSCLYCTYSEIAIGAIGIIFQVLNLPYEGAKFLCWALEILPLNLVGLYKSESPGARQKSHRA